jgi:hypothetical protein
VKTERVKWKQDFDTKGDEEGSGFSLSSISSSCQRERLDLRLAVAVPSAGILPLRLPGSLV